MSEYVLSAEDLVRFEIHLGREERSKATIEKYLRDTRKFYNFLGIDKKIEKEKIIAYKESLAAVYKISSANSMLASLNSLLTWIGLESCKVKQFKVQRQLFCSRDRSLSKEEYERLIYAAGDLKKERVGLIMQTICSTGIRISELSYITVEAAVRGVVSVRGKGKQRLVFIPEKLRIYLLDYCRKHQIGQGSIFLGKAGKPINRVNVWAEMKRLCETAEVACKKVFPHNLRHLFARTYYNQKKDIVYLADILGHSSIDTTRIYTISSGDEHERLVSQLGLVL